MINVPVVVLALIAVAFLLPESRSAERPGADFLGVILSSAGLAGLTYGFIKAGQDGWTNDLALGTIAAGVAVLAVLVAAGRPPGGRPGHPRHGRRVHRRHHVDHDAVGNLVQRPADHRGHVRAHRPGPGPAGSRPSALRVIPRWILRPRAA
jgi:hypothetical protein